MKLSDILKDIAAVFCIFASVWIGLILAAAFGG